MDHYLLILFESTKLEVFINILLYMVHVCRFFTIVESLPGYEQKKKSAKNTVLFIAKKKRKNFLLNYLLNQILEYPFKTVKNEIHCF